jgi:hypothetical protein
VRGIWSACGGWRGVSLWVFEIWGVVGVVGEALRE